MKRRVQRHEVIQPLDPSYRLIPLTQGQNAIVDTEDYEWLNQSNWYAQWNRLTESFYAQSNIKDIKIIMHRLLLGCGHGEQGDHKNRNSLDNRKQNLRKCTNSQNKANTRRIKTGKSGFIGVTRCKRKWKARIGINRKSINLGYFRTPEEAAKKRDKAAIKFHGEFAVLNFPGGL